MIQLLICVCVSLATVTPQQSYQDGNAAMTAGDHQAAAAHFMEALSQGGHHPAVYHGLGNVLYRQGKYGEAVASYRRGLRLDPSDGDIAANLERVRKQTTDLLDPPHHATGPFFWSGWMSERSSGLVGSWVLCFGLAALVVRRWRREQRVIAWVARVGLLVGGLLLLSTWVSVHQLKTVVVTASQISANSALGPDGVALFALHAGAEVDLLERSIDEQYALIALPDGRKGWVDAVGLISTDPNEPFESVAR